jgi:hypothetical protein
MGLNELRITTRGIGIIGSRTESDILPLELASFVGDNVVLSVAKVEKMVSGVDKNHLFLKKDQ